MTTENTTIPAALANDPEAERAALQKYLASDKAQSLIAAMQSAYEALVPCYETANVADTTFDDAESFIDRSDDATTNADALASYEKQLREGFLDNFGVPGALQAIARTLQTQKTQKNIDALRHGLELMCFSDRKLPSELREDLVALGMPEKFKGGALNTYRLATFGAWDRKIFPTEDDADGVDFIEGGQTKSMGPEFVEMTPEDEANIHLK